MCVYTHDIHMTTDILQLLSVGGIITNCALMGITSTQLRAGFNHASDMTVFLFLFFIEHIMLLFKYFLHATLPKVPTRV